MAVTPQQFKDLATRLTTDTFGAFFVERTFTAPAGGYDPITGTSTPGASESVPTYRQDYDERQFDGQAIQRGDFKLLARVDEFTTVDPSVDGVTVDVDGVTCQIVQVMKDGADAMYTMQVRKL